ncbi:MAG: sensor histidine kinase [Flavobacteriales bacterium]
MTSTIFSQEPSYSIIGENELAGLDIYTLAQDKSNYIWLGTENGIYRYDGYIFKKYDNENLKAKSIFGLKKDNNNDLYCFNLSGQILKIHHDSIQVFYQIPDSLLSSFYEIDFDVNNNLIVVGFTPFWVDKLKRPHLYFKSGKNSFINSVKRDKSKIYFSHQNNNQYEVEVIDGKKKNSLLQFDEKGKSPKIILQNTLGYTIIKDRDDFNYYDIYGDSAFYRNFYLDESFAHQYSNVSYLSPDSTLWQTTRKGSSVALNKNKSAPFHKQLLFKNFYISSYLQDAENNLWLATLGKGILFVPNTKVLSFRNINELDNEVFTKIISINDKIYVSTQSGKIYEYQHGKFSLIYNENESKISVLKFDNQKENLVINGSHLPYNFNLKTKTITPFIEIGSLKDVDWYNDSIFILATNKGLVFYNKFLKKQITSNFKMPENMGRTSSVFYQKSEHTIWSSTLKGLMVFSEKEAPQIFDSIYSTGIIEHNKSIWVATKGRGIYQFENGKIKQHLTSKKELLSNIIYKIIAIDNTLFITHELGLQVYDIQTGKSSNFDQTDGLFSNRITDFAIQNNMAWIITNKGLQFFNYKDVSKNLSKPNIIINQVFVNDSLVDFNSNKTSFFNYNENRIAINFITTSYHHQGRLKYAYKINEIGNKWQYKNFNDNTVDFTSLQSGSYTFIVKSISENGIESTPISYHFIIKPPFWQTWWFYGILASIFVSITIIIYRFELKKQRRKIELQNELNASKLIAIQSQMNPHFIFNAINSIQDLILKGDIDNSYNYIIKFSKLVRQTLNFSDKEFIDIEEEIELLETYLELEKLRFKDDFEFKIHINNAEDIQVPPMLIQPFVENAIKHGLLHKDGLKKVDISFKMNDTLHCTVTDNGVGRKKAQEIKDRQQKKHQSFSVNATKIRFDIMKNHYKQSLGVFYTDLEQNGESSGTKVLINMPFKQNY